MAVADSSCIPLAVYIAPAAPHEITLVRETLQRRFLQARPRDLSVIERMTLIRLIVNFNKMVSKYFFLIDIYRIRPKIQNGRPLRRYAKRR